MDGVVKNETQKIMNAQGTGSPTFKPFKPFNLSTFPTFHLSNLSLTGTSDQLFTLMLSFAE
jgi:hypothetical protein